MVELVFIKILCIFAIISLFEVCDGKETINKLSIPGSRTIFTKPPYILKPMEQLSPKFELNILHPPPVSFIQNLKLASNLDGKEIINKLSIPGSITIFTKPPPDIFKPKEQLSHILTPPPYSIKKGVYNIGPVPHESSKFKTHENSMTHTISLPDWEGPEKKFHKEPGLNLTNDEIKKFKLWPKGNIPYYIDVRSYNDKGLRNKIRGFLSSVNRMTNLNFMELSSPPNDDTTRWVFFVNRRGLLGCADHSIKNFTNEGVQQVVLGYDCMSTSGELPEAVLAIAGVPPQHNAPNRDDYIHVISENIMPEKKYLFDKLNNDEWLFHDVPYDFLSAGHYHYHKYSSNGRATINTQENYAEVTIGQTFGFSNGDIRKLRMLYNYISMKPEDQVQECNKLFVPGAQFLSYRPRYKEKRIRIPKPPRKPMPKSTPKWSPKSNDNNKDDSHIKGVTVEVGMTGDVDLDSTAKVPEADPEDINTSHQLMKKQVNAHGFLKVTRDPLLSLSDYRTGDEMYMKKRNKKAGDKYMRLRTRRPK